MDRSITLCALDDLIEECHVNSVAHGFWEGKSPTSHGAEKIALMHSELSEALEVIRKTSCQTREAELAEELADCVIRIFDFAGAAGLNLPDELLRKMERNRSRPHKHGKAF